MVDGVLWLLEVEGLDCLFMVFRGYWTGKLYGRAGVGCMSVVIPVFRSGWLGSGCLERDMVLDTC